MRGHDGRNGCDYAIWTRLTGRTLRHIHYDKRDDDAEVVPPPQARDVVDSKQSLPEHDDEQVEEMVAYNIPS